MLEADEMAALKAAQDEWEPRDDVPRYETVKEARARVYPKILCQRCLVRTTWDRLVCPECAQELDALALKRKVYGAEIRSASSLPQGGIDIAGVSEHRTSWSRRRAARQAQGA